MQVPVEEIISRETALYFADFYCNPRECAEKQPNPGGRQKRESEKILEERQVLKIIKIKEFYLFFNKILFVKLKYVKNIQKFLRIVFFAQKTRLN